MPVNSSSVVGGRENPIKYGGNAGPGAAGLMVAATRLVGAVVSTTAFPCVCAPAVALTVNDTVPLASDEAPVNFTSPEPTMSGDRLTMKLDGLAVTPAGSPLTWIATGPW